MKDVKKYAIINSFLTATYIIILVSSIFSLDKIIKAEEIFMFPIIMLMLFVFSAAVTGMLVFGRPIIWYLDGRKKDAISLIFYTLGIFLLIFLVSLVFLISISK